MLYTEDIFKPCAIAAYIVKKQDNEWRFLLLQRCSSYLTGTWQMVTGGLEVQENAYQGALREIFEETGLKPTRLYAADTVETFYEIKRDRIMINPCFVAFIDNEQDVILSPYEHDAYEWASYEQAFAKLAFAEQCRILKHIRDNFLLKEPNKWLAIAL